MRYREKLPCPSLRPFVLCYWQIAGTLPSSQAVTHRVLPDGCADLLFDLEHPVHLVGSEGQLPSTRLVGTMRSAIQVTLRGRVDLFGVRFRPGGAYPFFGFPLEEITDQHRDIEDGPVTRALRFSNQLVDCREFSSRARLLDHLLIRLASRRPSPDDCLSHAIARLERTAGRLKIRELALGCGLGERQLARKFKIHVGLSPKAFAGVLRFRSAVDGALVSQPTWAGLAVDSGYYDQAHFIKEFQRFSGLTPRDWKAEMRALSSFDSPP